MDDLCDKCDEKHEVGVGGNRFCFTHAVEFFEEAYKDSMDPADIETYNAILDVKRNLPQNG